MVPEKDSSGKPKMYWDGDRWMIDDPNTYIVATWNSVEDYINDLCAFFGEHEKADCFIAAIKSVRRKEGEKQWPK